MADHDRERDATSVLTILSGFQQAHHEELGIRRIGLFGSTARNELAEDSGVDTNRIGLT